MVVFHELIKEARKRLGFSTAKDFHRSKSTELSMSYESFSNIEAGKYLPPAEKLVSLAQALEIKDLKTFIFSYCSTLMPNDLFRSFFSEHTSARSLVLQSDSYTNYKEKFHALLQFTQMQTKYELSPEQIQYLETDIVAWDVINLFISKDETGLSELEISEKTSSPLERTRERIQKLHELKMLKQLESGRWNLSQDAFIIPRRPYAKKLTHALVKRELEKCYSDTRNQPYARFRMMSIDPEDRDQIEMFIDNFILDSRRFKKESGKTHYIQVLFSDRVDLG